AQGREALERFVRNDLASGEKPVAVESEFRFRFGQDQVSGRWDRIDERPEGIVLVDYKTSEVDEDDRAAERAKEFARDGQLGLYALAYRETRGVVPARVELRFVGSGTAGSVAVEAEHLERAQERIERAAAGIRAADFEARPAARTCGHCDYRQICPHSAARSGP
ncbi:MAG: RecB family exonuclease, partial [Candidatus Eiseniibacteriota bacterium]